MTKCALEGCNKKARRRFCCNKHKDRYHNMHNPRGYYAHLSIPDVSDKSLDEQMEDLENYYYSSSHPGDPDSLGQD